MTLCLSHSVSLTLCRRRSLSESSPNRSTRLPTDMLPKMRGRLCESSPDVHLPLLVRLLRMLHEVCALGAPHGLTCERLAQRMHVAMTRCHPDGFANAARYDDNSKLVVRASFPLLSSSAPPLLSSSAPRQARAACILAHMTPCRP